MIRTSALFLAIASLFWSLSVASDTGFKSAVPNRVFSFPQDHGKHPEFKTEWWYFTGNLAAADGSTFGFQLTFFRRGLAADTNRRSQWAATDVYAAHFAITKVDSNEFFHSELISREGPGLAGASASDLDVYVRDWKVKTESSGIRLVAHEGEYRLDLLLSQEKPPVLHGRDGYSLKGDSDSQASYYYSLTRLKVTGHITFKGSTHEVNGLAWMDHEFGSSILLADQTGWDWFSIQLDDGTELMVFHMRKADGTNERPFGTFISAQGEPVQLSGKQIVIKSSSTWKSPNTGAVYPARWSVEIPDLSLNLVIEPLIPDQELAATRSTGVVYWEGAIAVKGTKEGSSITGKGYVELTGYAGSLGGKI